MPRVTITVADRNPQPYRFQLDRMEVNLGRGSDNDIVIDDGSVSGRHAVMERVEGGYQLRDLRSTNGIKIDGDRREIIPLRRGLSVKIGDVAFDFTLSDEEHDALAREKPPEESPIIREEPVTVTARGPLRPVTEPVAVPTSQPGAVASFFMTLLFLLLAGVAFFVGLTVRHEKETGRTLWNDILAGDVRWTPEPADPAPSAREEASE